MAECCCGNDGVTLLYACSGAANTGYLADQVARKIMNDGCGRYFIRNKNAYRR